MKPAVLRHLLDALAVLAFAFCFPIFYLADKITESRSNGGDDENRLKGCIRTLLVIEKGSFPDATCQKCEDLRKCLKLEPEVQRGLAAGR